VFLSYNFFFLKSPAKLSSRPEALSHLTHINTPSTILVETQRLNLSRAAA
jgi:hypothetical protein